LAAGADVAALDDELEAFFGHLWVCVCVCVCVCVYE
jgi:hypothetical protein